MNDNQRLWRPIIVIFIILPATLALGIFLLFELLPPAHEEARKVDCLANLKDIGKAVAAYREDNGGYFPFSWQRSGEAEPEGTGAANAAMAGTSLGNLYPRYLQKANLFRCPSTEDDPSFMLNLPAESRGAVQVKTQGGRQIETFVGTLPQSSNWTLVSNQPVGVFVGQNIIRASSYGYDPRIWPRAPGGHVVAADWDGSWQLDHDTSTQNHDEGQNVLFVDGHAKWKKNNFCSNDPNDNVFSEDNWDADRDSFLVDSDAALSVSFDGYKHLHYPPEDRRASPQKAKPQK